MKKFYLLIMALVCYATTVLAQNPYNNPPQCPAVRAEYFTVPGTNYCKIFIGNGPTASPADTPVVQLISPSVAPFNGAPIPDLNGVVFTKMVNSGGAGYASIAYGCQTIDHIEIDFNQGGHHYTCKYAVAPGGSLPIKLSSLTGRLSTETDATITWTSSLEENSYKYEVQRSADGKNFVTVGTVNAAGISLDPVKYSFNDPLPGTGAYYYRLKMVDHDGFTEVSKVVYVNSKKGSGVVTKIFPNPFTSEVQLIGATSSDLISNNIKVFTVTGQMVKYNIVGANAIAIDVSAPKGMYIVRFKDQTFKLNKQ
jgi:hypothetical protein